MPFFGSKKEKKEKCTGDAPMYPRQQAPPPPQVGHYPPMGNTYPQGSFVNQTDQFYYNPTGQFQSAPASGPSYTMAFVRNDLPGSQENWAEGFLDGPDFSNRVPDRSIPPAPGSYYFYSHVSAPGPAPPPMTMMVPSAPPSVASSSSSCPPPPSYEDVLSQEIKKQL